MTDNALLRQELARCIGEVLRVEIDPDRGDANLVTEYGADSMDVVDIVERLERRYGAAISDEQVRSVRTFADILTLIQPRE